MALNQHLSHSFCARVQARSNDGNNTPESPMSLANEEVETDQMLADAPPLPHISILKAPLEMPHDFDDVTHQMDGFLEEEEEAYCENAKQNFCELSEDEMIDC
jgi:hypothetical protein